jgi:DNA-binding XRE family transcriptional regulator/ribosomal protein L22
MARISVRKKEKAFRLRMERRPFAAISKEIGVSAKTISRWEAGWVDGKGRKHPGWKVELEKAWRERADAQMDYGLMLKDERLRTYEDLARLAVTKIKEAFPAMNVKTAADAKALLSEVRELLKCIAKEKGELNPSPQTLIAVKADININELAQRYEAAQVIETAVSQAVEDKNEDPGNHLEDDAEPGSPDEVADDD